MQPILYRATNSCTTEPTLSARIPIDLGHHFHTVTEFHPVFCLGVETEVKINEAEATNSTQSRRTECVRFNSIFATWCLGTDVCCRHVSLSLPVSLSFIAAPLYLVFIVFNLVCSHRSVEKMVLTASPYLYICMSICLSAVYNLKNP